MASIDHLAVVHPAAVLGQGVTVGPFCVIEQDVVIGDDCYLASHIVIKQGTRLGCRNQIHEGAVLGGRPQHLRAGQTLGRLQIGNDNIIREHATLHRGLTVDDCTTIGNQNLIMVGAHVGHDCRIGNHTILANNVLLSGHVVVEDYAYLSGAVAVHQFCHVGQQTMVGGQAHVTQDVPPYVLVDGASSRVVGLNTIGLRRRQFTSAELLQLKEAYRVIYHSGLRWEEMLHILKTQFASGHAAAFGQFLERSKRGIMQERRGSRMATLRLMGVDKESSDQLRKAG